MYSKNTRIFPFGDTQGTGNVRSLQISQTNSIKPSSSQMKTLPDIGNFIKNESEFETKRGDITETTGLPGEEEESNSYRPSRELDQFSKIKPKKSSENYNKTIWKKQNENKFNSGDSTTSLEDSWMEKISAKISKLILTEIREMDFEIDFDLTPILIQALNLPTKNMPEIERVFNIQDDDCSIGKFAAFRLFCKKFIKTN